MAEKKEVTGAEVPCTVVLDLLPLFIESELTPEAAAVVQAHLDHCPDCRDVYELGRRDPTALSRRVLRLRFGPSEGPFALQKDLFKLRRRLWLWAVAGGFAAGLVAAVLWKVAVAL